MKELKNPHGSMQEVFKAMSGQKAKPADLPALAEQQVSKERLQKYPQMKNFPKDGVVKPDRYGNLIRFFPDGRAVVEKAKEKNG